MDLNLFDEVTALAILRRRPYSSIKEVEAAIPDHSAGTTDSAYYRSLRQRFIRG